MKQRVCTGWSPKGREEYGNRFLRAFNQHWPVEVELQVYVEDAGRAMGLMVERDLWAIPGAREFAIRHRDDPIMNGREPRQGFKPREIATKYSFRFDAYKFFKQILIPGAASAGLEDGDILIWLDGDTVTLNPVPLNFVPELLGTADVAFLNREPKHSEIGFWAVRISNLTRLFLLEMTSIYTSDEFIDLPQWHSAFIWDVARKRFKMNERHLCPAGSRGHVWPSSPLARYLRHDKGKRKGAPHG